MQKTIFIALLALLLVPTICEAAGRTYVRGHVRKDGTYVPPHYRTSPDGNFYNNWSTLGNINPYTGKPGTKTMPPRLRFRPSTVSDFAFAPVPPAISSTSSPPRPVQSLPRERVPSVGVPDDIDTAIQSLARSQWPNDFSMQAYTIKKQREGYVALGTHLQRYSSLGLPEEVRDWALRNAEQEWPTDYSMQAYSYDKNLEGYFRLSALLSSDEWKALPESHANWMLEIAYAQWSNDFSMQAYVVEKQIDGYYDLSQLEVRLQKLPADVATRIRDKARSSWPSDLSMQAYTVEREIDGYLELRKLQK